MLANDRFLSTFRMAVRALFSFGAVTLLIEAANLNMDTEVSTMHSHGRSSFAQSFPTLLTRMPFSHWLDNQAEAQQRTEDLPLAAMMGSNRTG